MGHLPPDPRDIIRKLAAAKGFRSDRALARAAGVSQPTLSRYMSRKTGDMDVGNFRLIAATLGVTLSELLGETALYSDPRVTSVVHAMESLPDEGKDALIAAAVAMAKSMGSRDK